MGIVVGLFALLYGLLNTPAVQNYIRELIVEELKDKLESEVSIARLTFHPFNSMELDSVYLYDQSNQKVLVADKIMANINMLDLAFNRKLVFNTAKISDFEVYLSKDSSNSPLNIQYIIDAFKPKEKKDSKAKLEIKLNAISLINGSFRYDVKDKEHKSIFDVNHIHVSKLNARLSLKSLTADSLNIQIKKLSLKERSGLEIENLTTRLITQEKKAWLKGFSLELPNSHIQLDKCEVDMTNIKSNKDILDNALFNCIIIPSYISPKDVSAFTPSLQYFKDIIQLEARISGSVDNINISNLSLGYGEKMSLISNIEIKDTRFPEKMYILGSVDDFTITGKEIEGLINNFSKEKTVLPPNIKQLESITFEGDVSGYLNQMTAFGSFETELGIIQTDILFGFNKKKDISSYVEGKIYTTDFKIGKLLQPGNNDFDEISLNLSVKLEKPKYSTVRGSLETNVYNIDYKGHTYSNVVLDVNYDGLRFEGLFNVEDEFGSIDINGLFDLSNKEYPELDFVANVRDLQLDKLNISNKMKDSHLSFAINANFIGKNIDDAEGYISIDSLDFIRESKRLKMNKFYIEASGLSSDRRLHVKSDILNGEVVGAYSFSTMINSVQQTLHAYLPALITEISQKQKKKLEIKDNNLTFNFQINNTQQVSDILNFPAAILSPAKIIGFYNNKSEKFKLEVFAPSLQAGGVNIKSGYILAENPSEKINTQISALIIPRNETINSIDINSTISNNIVDTKIVYLNEYKKAKGNFALNTTFSKVDETPLSIDISLLPGTLSLNNGDWKMDQSHVFFQDNSFVVDDFFAYNVDKTQEIKIDGKYSKTNPSQILKMELKNINLDYIFETLAINALQFGGSATGNAFLSSIEGRPYANTRLDVKDFHFNKTLMGDLNVFSELDENTNVIMIDGKVVNKDKKVSTAKGELDPINRTISLDFDADSLDVGFLNHYAKKLFNNLSGRGTGKVRLFGDFSNITVEGQAFVHNGNIGINILNTNYTFSDSIYLKEDLIYYNNLVLTDAYNNKAVSSGKIVHEYFKNIMYYIDLSAQKFLVYNATEKHNPVFSGRVFGTGKGSISGDEQAVNIDVSMRTEEKTEVRMNFIKEAVNEYNFITYKDSRTTTDSSKVAATTAIINNDSPFGLGTKMAVNMNFYIDVTPNASVEIAMDPVAGDILKTNGSGTLQFEWSNKSAPRIFGNYLINRGSYLFTFQRLLERKFTIEDGSNVFFKGDPFEAALNAKAIYKITANLNDLDRSIVKTTGQTSIPVNCILNLSGLLKHPKIELDLAFPSADPEVERQIKVLLNSEDMINRQVAYLLLLSKFYTPSYVDNEYKTSDFASVASATLSNQLTKIISQIDSRWQVGTNIRTSDSEMTSTEVELLLSSQLLNDRLLINGNFGYRDDPSTNTQDAFIGDVDVEFLLNPSGSWRIKAYNHYNEKYYYTGTSVQTQGVGLKYKKDFDKVVELMWWRFNQQKTAKQDTIRPNILPDSTKKGSPLSPFIKVKE